MPGGFAVNPNLAIVLPFMCHEDEATAVERGLDGGHFFGFSLLHYYAFGDHHPGRTDIWDEFQENRSLFGFDRDDRGRTGRAPRRHDRAERHRLAARRGRARPTRSATSSAAYEEVGVDQVIFVAQAGRNRHEHICESLELFGREVMPEFAERADAAEKEKLERLAPAMEAALARREPARVVDPDYSFPAVMKP